MTGSCPVSAHVCRETAKERDELRDALGILVKRQTDDQLKIERLTRERDELRRWKDEALPVLTGLQELGKALELSLGSRITGQEALAAVEHITRERDELRRAFDNACDRVLALLSERDKARAEVVRLRAGVGELLEDKSQHFHVTRKIPGATVTEYNDPLVRTSRLRALLNPTEGEK